MATTGTSHVVLDERGRAWIEGANTKVAEVVLDKLAWGLSVEEIHCEHPHLSLAEIHAALAYYYDHQASVDAEIEVDRKFIEASRANEPDSLLRARLRNLGRLQ